MVSRMKGIKMLLGIVGGFFIGFGARRMLEHKNKKEYYRAWALVILGAIMVVAFWALN